MNLNKFKNIRVKKFPYLIYNSNNSLILRKQMYLKQWFLKLTYLKQMLIILLIVHINFRL